LHMLLLTQSGHLDGPARGGLSYARWDEPL